MPIRPPADVTEASSFLRALVSAGHVEVVDDGIDGLAPRLLSWSSGDGDELDADRIGDWFLDQPEVVEVFASGAVLVAALAQLSWSRMPPSVVPGPKRRDCFAAQAEAAAAIFSWYADRSEEAGASDLLSRLLVLLEGPGVSGVVLAKGEDPFSEDPDATDSIARVWVDLDPLGFGEAGERAVDPTTEELLDVLLVAARLPAIAPRLAKLNANTPFHVHVYGADASSMNGPFVPLDVFGPMPVASVVARELVRGGRHR